VIIYTEEWLDYIVVGVRMYNVSHSSVQMGKDWMQIILKEGTYHPEQYVEILLE
jgi:hypothetical protein